jgi:hypothetical protein
LENQVACGATEWDEDEGDIEDSIGLFSMKGVVSVEVFAVSQKIIPTIKSTPTNAIPLIPLDILCFTSNKTSSKYTLNFI